MCERKRAAGLLPTALFTLEGPSLVEEDLIARFEVSNDDRSSFSKQMELVVHALAVSPRVEVVVLGNDLSFVVVSLHIDDVVVDGSRVKHRVHEHAN